MKRSALAQWFMLAWIVVGATLVWLSVYAACDAGQPKKKPPRRVEADSVSAMTSRIVNMHWKDCAVANMWTCVAGEDNTGQPVMLGIVEFADGGLGLYLAAENENNDQWIALTKTQARVEMLKQAIERAASR